MVVREGGGQVTKDSARAMSDVDPRVAGLEEAERDCEERTAIVLWLRSRTSDDGITKMEVAALSDAADAIERGEHRRSRTCEKKATFQLFYILTEIGGDPPRIPMASEAARETILQVSEHGIFGIVVETNLVDLRVSPWQYAGSQVSDPLTAIAKDGTLYPDGRTSVGRISAVRRLSSADFDRKWEPFASFKGPSRKLKPGTFVHDTFTGLYGTVTDREESLYEGSKKKITFIEVKTISGPRYFQVFSRLKVIEKLPSEADALAELSLRHVDLWEDVRTKGGVL